MSLRPYQEAGLDQIRSHFKAGTKKVLLHLATGGGKTHIFSHILKTMHKSGRPAIMIVRGRKLVEQAHQRLVHEGVWHGVHMANHWNCRPGEKIQICSIDTLTSRQIYPPAELIVIDEAHRAVSTNYRGFLKAYPNAFVLAVTATPYTDASLEHVADAIVKPISMKGLVELGFLVPPKYFCPRRPDLTGVKISSSTKDYVQDQLSAKMDQPHITGDLVDQYQKLGQGRPAIVFCVTVQHSKNVCDAFNAAGIPAAHMDAATTDEERLNTLKAFERGEFRVVTNCGILCEGVDLPFVSCIVLARPTKSYLLYIQQAGRGTRPAKNKSDFLILDHADNVRRHGFIDDEPQVFLEGRFEKGISKVRICSECYLAYVGSCPECGPQAKPLDGGGMQREVLQIEGDLEEMKREKERQERVSELDPIQELKRYEEIAAVRGYSRGWIWHQMKDRFGEQVAGDVVYAGQRRTSRIPDHLLRRLRS